MRWRGRRAAVLVLVGIVGATALTRVLAAGAQVIPVPDLLVVVTTKSGSVTRTSLVPIGGAPIPIDVDGTPVLGLLEPDIDVSVGLVAIEELPDRPIVPNVVVRRNALAIALKRPAPPLEIDAKIVLRDAGNGLATLAEMHYGFTTPPGTRMPPVVSAKLVGPIEGGFVDPLQAKLDSPGYSGPLNFHINVLTPDLAADFRLDFDALPEALFFEQHARVDGLDATYRHTAPIADVHLDAQASLRNRATNELVEVGANVERLPQEIALSSTVTEEQTLVTYDSSSALAKPDVRATYRDTDGAGVITTDAALRIEGLPFHMRGQIDTSVDDEGAHVDAIDFRVLDDAADGGGPQQIDALEFVARNWIDDPGTLPEPDLGPDQHIAFASRRVDADHSRYRAAGRVLGIRSVNYRQGKRPEDPIEATTDLGDGVRPLRALVDIDTRGPGADADARRMQLDTTLAPLPRQIHTTFDASDGGEDATVAHYDASAGLDITLAATIAEGSADACGEPRVTCLSSRIDKVPTLLDVTLPGPTGTDIALSHNGTEDAQPDAAAVVDRTGETATDRTWADVALQELPVELRARVDTTAKGVLRAAEFHGCSWDYGERGCTDTQGRIGRVEFTVRDRPSRAGLPERPATGPHFVSLVAADATLADNGDEHFEAVGRVDKVRNVAFHQRDREDDGRADGTLGVSVDVGGEKQPFDVAVDTHGRAADPKDETVDLGATSTQLDAHIDKLPSPFEACLRSPAEAKPPGPDELDDDPLLAPCDRTDVLDYDEGELQMTPLSMRYSGAAAMTLDAALHAEAPDPDDRDQDGRARPHTTIIDTTVARVPATIRTDMIPGVARVDGGAAGRALELGYRARDADGEPASINRVELRQVEARRSDSVCADPRPRRQATCLSATVRDVPAEIYASFDPNERQGGLELRSEPPLPGDDRMSINPLHVDAVAEDADAPLVLDGKILGLTPRLTGRVARRNLDPATAGRELAEVALNACLDEQDHDQCDGSGPYGSGIDTVELTATNSLIGRAVPDPPDALPGVGDRLTYLARGDRFLADVRISALREVLMSRIDPDDDNQLLAGTRLRAGFGRDTPGADMRVYSDLDDGRSQQLADLVLKRPPGVFEACLRDRVASADVDTGSEVWCERQAAASGAIQLQVRDPASAGKPDVELRRLLLRDAAGTSILTGEADIRGLGDRIDVLTSDDDVLVEGRKRGYDGQPREGELADVAGRIDVEMQNYLNGDEERIGAPDSADAFPWRPVNGGMVDPRDDDRNDDSGTGGDPGGRNYVRAITDPDGRFHVDASVPHVRRLGASPEPCYTDQRVRPAAEFPSGRTPVYSCVRASVAPGRPLGFAVRSLDEEGTALAVEEGHLHQAPLGDDGFEATIAAQPEEAALDPLCGPGVPQPCRVPQLSLENDRAAGQTADDTRLEARLLIGPLDLLRKLRGAQPIDEASNRLDYELAPRDWPADARGARVKIGSGDDGEGALRIGLKVALPRYLDLYPPTSWSCAHVDVSAASCADPLVGEEWNFGHQSTDLFFKLVAAEDRHDGAGHGYLGRIALLVHPFGDGGQIVLTGAKTPNGENAFGRQVTGASSVSPETLHEIPGDDASLLGARLPGHLDVKVQIRNDYAAEQDPTPVGIHDNKNQQHFTQIDGRTNRPLSLTLRVNEKLVLTRSGHLVSGVQLSALNLPGTNDEDDFEKPSFRVRSELRPSHTGTSVLEDLHVSAMVKGILGVQEFLESLSAISNSPFYVSPVLPSAPEAGWLDVKLNADPFSDGDTTSARAARTVDAVAGPFGLINDADLAGFEQVGGSGGFHDKGDPALFTAQAALRLRELDLGIEGGVSLYGLISAGIQLAEVLDLDIGVTGGATERTRLKHVITALQIAAGEHGSVRVDAKARAETAVRVVVRAIFGLIEAELVDLRFGAIDQPVRFVGCPNILESENGGFSSNQFTGAAIALGTPDWSQVDGVDTAATATISSVLAVATGVLAPISCFIHPFFDAEDEQLVNRDHPAPRYRVDNHPVEGSEVVPGGPPVEDPPSQQPPPPVDVVIDGAETRCGFINAPKVTVKSTGTLRVGRENTVDAAGNECDGSLTINAGSVEVQAGGLIEADGKRLTSFDGSGAFGAGAGHGGEGGAAGDGGEYEGLAKPEDGDVPPNQDFGSVGGAGQFSPDPRGGAGGGAIVITAAENVRIDGLISANGGDGDDMDSGGVVGGGGSGGGVTIAGLRLLGSGTLRTRGGDGGNGCFGGGGGGGGHIRIETVTSHRPNLDVAGGSGGVSNGSSGCDGDGEDGDDGEDSLGDVLEMASEVSLGPSSPGPIQKEHEVELKLRAIQDGGGDLGLVVCRRDAPADEPDGLSSNAIDPPAPPSDAHSLVEAADFCFVREFDEPNSGSDEYQDTITVAVGDGWHGWYAIAMDDNECFINILFCAQERLPDTSGAAIGIDRSPPFIQTEPGPDPRFEASGVPGCPRDSYCVDTRRVQIDAPVIDPMIGLRKTRCRTGDGAWSDTCGRDPLHTVRLPRRQGVHFVDMEMIDKLGHADVNNLGPDHDPQHVEQVGRFFLDTVRPAKPTVHLEYPAGDVVVNGWHRLAPLVSVDASDDKPSSGFGEDPVTVLVDGGDQRCGHEMEGQIDQDVRTGCQPSELALPDEGKHEVVARVEDRAGNISKRSDKEKIKVDFRPPTSKLFLAPAKHDGEDGWYRTPPLFAFSAADNVGGSDVDLDRAPSGIRFRVDDGDWTQWDPDDENRLPEGVHTICWYATDVAGNLESDVEQPGPTDDPPRCREDIHVDSFGPVVKDLLSPSPADGANGFYVTEPTLTVDAGDPIVGGAARSGVARRERQIDDGDWESAASPVTLAEGEHVVRARAFDKAGNVSNVTERVVHVDLSPPSARLGSFPPAANVQGWFRQPRIVDVAVDDGAGGSGADGASVTVDNGVEAPYAGEFSMADGSHTVGVRPRDRAGLTGIAVGQTSLVDTVAPAAAPTGVSPNIVLSGLTGQSTTLAFTAGDALTPRVRVHVVVYNTLLGVVRVLDAPGPHAGGYRDAGAGQLSWDGRDAQNKGVLPGLYHYRVHATDQAGNTVMSTESPAFLVILGLLPL